MKTKRAGIVLVVIGLIMIVYTGFNYVTTEKVREHLKCPTNDSVSALKKAINRKIQFDLSLEDTEVLNGKQGSGYRINPKVTIKKLK